MTSVSGPGADPGAVLVKGEVADAMRQTSQVLLCQAAALDSDIRWGVSRAQTACSRAPQDRPDRGPDRVYAGDVDRNRFGGSPTWGGCLDGPRGTVPFETGPQHPSRPYEWPEGARTAISVRALGTHPADSVLASDAQ